MTSEQALKILNNNNSGRIYTLQEAAAAKYFFGTLAIISKDQLLQSQRKAKMIIL